MKRNVIVGQSGGPTAVINSSLAGVYKTARDRGFHKVYGMLHGIQGFLDEKYIDLNDYNCMAVITSQTFDDNGMQFEYTQSRHRPDYFRFQDIASRRRK